MYVLGNGEKEDMREGSDIVLCGCVFVTSKDVQNLNELNDHDKYLKMNFRATFPKAIIFWDENKNSWHELEKNDIAFNMIFRHSPKKNVTFVSFLMQFQEKLKFTEFHWFCRDLLNIIDFERIYGKISLFFPLLLFETPHFFSTEH